MVQGIRRLVSHLMEAAWGTQITSEGMELRISKVLKSSSIVRKVNMILPSFLFFCIRTPDLKTVELVANTAVAYRCLELHQ